MKMVEVPQKGRKTLWEKGEIARQEQFLIFPHCFQRIYTVDT